MDSEFLFAVLTDALGYVGNGTSTPVRIDQDDATRTWFFTVGYPQQRNQFTGDSLSGVITAYYEKHKKYIMDEGIAVQDLFRKRGAPWEDGMAPCPLCGDSPWLQINEPHTHPNTPHVPDHKGSVVIECSRCPCAILVDGLDVNLAKATWNRRTPAETSRPPVPSPVVAVPGVDKKSAERWWDTKGIHTFEEVFGPVSDDDFEKVFWVIRNVHLLATTKQATDMTAVVDKLERSLNPDTEVSYKDAIRFALAAIKGNGSR